MIARRDPISEEDLLALGRIAQVTAPRGTRAPRFTTYEYVFWGLM